MYAPINRQQPTIALKAVNIREQAMVVKLPHNSKNHHAG